MNPEPPQLNLGLVGSVVSTRPTHRTPPATLPAGSFPLTGGPTGPPSLVEPAVPPDDCPPDPPDDCPPDPPNDCPPDPPEDAALATVEPPAPPDISPPDAPDDTVLAPVLRLEPPALDVEPPVDTPLPWDVLSPPAAVFVLLSADKHAVPDKTAQVATATQVGAGEHRTPGAAVQRCLVILAVPS